MPDYVVGDILEVVFKSGNTADPGSTFINRIHFRVKQTGAGGTITEESIARNLGGAWGTSIRTIMSSSADYRSCTVQGWPSGVKSAGTEKTNGSGAGARGALLAAPQTAFCVRKRTASAGRQYRGRFFVPGVCIDDCPGGIVTAGLNATWIASDIENNMMGDWTWVEAGETEKVEMIVAAENGANAPIFRALVTSGFMDPYARSQRRRQIGRGT